jgi:3-phosphoshikimate 1-carboxyvinyltransferase
MKQEFEAAKVIEPAEVSGSIVAPASKSMMQRAVAAAMLSSGTTIIRNISSCDDAKTAIEIAKTLGAEIHKKRGTIQITGAKKPKSSELHCNESGLCMRMFIPIAALYTESTKKSRLSLYKLTASGSLLKRPVVIQENVLEQLGVKCKTTGAYTPVTVQGPIHSGSITLHASESSQFLTGLLMTLPLCDGDSTLEVLSLRSRPYIDMTLFLLKKFGVIVQHERIEENRDRFLIRGKQTYRAITYNVECDWSAAAFLLVAGAIAGKITVSGLDMGSKQADKAIIKVLKSAGARLKVDKTSITVEKKELNAFEFDATDCPDLFPPLAVLACNCNGKSIIYGTDRLRHKESDRATSLRTELGKMGALINVVENRMEIVGKKLSGGKVDSQQDHRIAMACAIAALNSEHGVEITNWKCVSKSYPDFFKDLSAVAKIRATKKR